MALMIAPENERRGGNWRRILLAAVLALPVLVIGLVAMLFDPEDYKPQIIAAVKQATGRERASDGKLRLTFVLRPTIAADRVRFANAPEGSRSEMLRLERIEARIALLPLLQNQQPGLAPARTATAARPGGSHSVAGWQQLRRAARDAGSGGGGGGGGANRAKHGGDGDRHSGIGAGRGRWRHLAGRGGP